MSTISELTDRELLEKIYHAQGMLYKEIKELKRQSVANKGGVYVQLAHLAGSGDFTEFEKNVNEAIEEYKKRIS